MLREALEEVEHCSGKRLYAFAPSAEAVGVLRQEGFENATTIASLLVSPERQVALAGNLLLIDETGLTSIKDMQCVLDIAQEQVARVILCGDRNQHRAVERGDTLRILEKTSRLRATLQERGIVSAKEHKVDRLDSLDLTEAQKRDELAYRPGLATFLHHGLRCEELCGLRVRDLQSRQGVAHLRVFGKGNKVRDVPATCWPWSACTTACRPPATARTPTGRCSGP